MKSLRSILIVALAALAGPLTAQDAAAYVSRLTAQPGPTSVLLTWKDAEGYDGAVYEVWRSEKEILKDSLPQAKLLATVKAGVEAYEDTTVTNPSFYLVLLKDANGNRKGYFIPFRNKTTTAVKPLGSGPAATATVKVGSVTYASPQVLVPFTAYPADRKLVVFRRAAPIASLADLKDATLLGNTTGAQAPFRDTPAPGLEFYYALLDAQAFADGKKDAFQVDNTTDRPAGFPLVALPTDVQATTLDSTLRPGIDRSTRSLPLPRLQVGTEPDSGAPLVQSAFEPVQAQSLDPKTTAALKAWSKAVAAPVAGLPAPVVLPEERSATQKGAAQYLLQIQQAYLGPKDWKGAQQALETLLKLSLDDRTEARARFYLGETLAYQKAYRQSFVEFLSARAFYPAETTPFLEGLFIQLEALSD